MNYVIENFAVRNSAARTNCRLNWARPKSPNERDSVHSASPEVEEFGELPEGCPSHSHSGKLPSKLAKACFNDETGTYYPSAKYKAK